MLILRIKPDGERLQIGNVTIEYKMHSAGQLMICIDAPREVPIVRTPTALYQQPAPSKEEGPNIWLDIPDGE